MSLTVHSLQYMEIKGQLDAIEWFLLQNLLSAQHVSGTIIPIIRRSGVIQMVAACSTWRFGLQVVGLVWNGRLCVRVAGCCLSNISQPGPLVCRSLVWSGAVGYASGLLEQHAATRTFGLQVVGLVWSCRLRVRVA